MKDRRETIMMILAFMGVLAPLALLGILLLKAGAPVDNLTAGFIGVIVGSYTTVFSYYFGSSSGSKSKQETIDKMTVEAPIVETEEEKKARYIVSGSALSFAEWIKLPENAQPK